MFLSFLDGSVIANFALTKKFRSIFFVSSFWTSQRKMKTPSVGVIHIRINYTIVKVDLLDH